MQPIIWYGTAAALIGIALLGIVAVLIIRNRRRRLYRSLYRSPHLAASLQDVRLEAIQGENITLRNTSDEPHDSTIYVMSDGDLRNSTALHNTSPILLQYRFVSGPRGQQTIRNTANLTPDLAGRRVVQQQHDSPANTRHVAIVGIVKN